MADDKRRQKSIHFPSLDLRPFSNQNQNSLKIQLGQKPEYQIFNYAALQGTSGFWPGTRALGRLPGRALQLTLAGALGGGSGGFLAAAGQQACCPAGPDRTDNLSSLLWPSQQGRLFLFLSNPWSAGIRTNSYFQSCPVRRTNSQPPPAASGSRAAAEKPPKIIEEAPAPAQEPPKRRPEALRSPQEQPS